MSRTALVLAVLGLTAACEVSGPELGSAPNPRPTLLRLQPEAFDVGGAGGTLVLEGAGFVDGATVHFGDEERTATSVSDSLLRMSLSATDLANASAHDVRVRNPEPGGGVSEAIALEIRRVAPALDSVSPDSVIVESQTSLTVRAFGRNFTPDASAVLWGGAALETTFVDAGELTAVVPDHMLRRAMPVGIQVRTEGPGGGTTASLSVDLTLRNPQPGVSSVEPDTVLIGAAAQLVVRGSGFTEEVEVRYNGDYLEPTEWNDARMTLDVPAELNTRGGVWLAVETEPPGGGVSDSVPIFVRERTPFIRALDPHRTFNGSPTMTVTIEGRDFAPDATVSFDGTPVPTTFVADSVLEVEVDASLQLTATTWVVTVTNPRGGGDSGPGYLPVLPSAEVAFVEWGARWLVSAQLLNGAEIARGPAPEICCEMDAAPRGRSVAFSGSTRVGDRVTIREGGIDRRLTDPSFDSVADIEASPRFSRDGEWIYFSATEPAVQGHTLWRIRVDGTQAIRLTPPVPVPRLRERPAPSPTGDRVAFSTSTIPPGVSRDLMVLDVATKIETSLGVDAIAQSWSPDGEWIAYIDRDGDAHIIRPDGTDGRRIGPQYSYGWGLDWSPDSQWLLTGTMDGYPVLISIRSTIAERLWTGLRGGSWSWFDDPNG